MTDIIPQLYLYSPKGKPLHGDLIMDSPKKIIYIYNIIISGQISSMKYAPPHHLMLLYHFDKPLHFFFRTTVTVSRAN